MTVREFLADIKPQADLIPAVERYFEFVQQMVQMNRDLTVKWDGGGERPVWCGL